MQTSEQHRPYVGSVICWAVETPHFMSAKLLRASAWDDMRDSGKLSEWTVQQRCITSRLLNDSFRTGTKINMLLAVSTIQLLLEFEVRRCCIVFSFRFFYVPPISIAGTLN
jgi:hypothetical protein